jgi:hypothetical protein
VSGDTVVVGAHHEASNATGVNGDQSDNSAPAAGAAYVFVRSGTSWSQQAYLKASNTDGVDFFADSLAVSGDTVVIGARSEASNATGVNGDEGDNSANLAGAAYVFVRSGTSWSQQAYLKASNTDAGDGFGWSVAVAGDTVVIGAYSEESGATGVNGDQGDNSAPVSGAAYVFVRSGTRWSQQAYLKASNTGLSDLFGHALGVSGDTLVIVAYREDSNATGVNGYQGNNGAVSSGAGYAFIDLEAWADMGCALAGVSGDPLLVGGGLLTADTTNVIGLSYAAPSSPCALFVALSSTPIPFKGGTLKPFPLLLQPIILATSPVGTLPLLFRPPIGLPSGTDLWLQFGIQDAAAIFGVSLSNAVVGTTP